VKEGATGLKGMSGAAAGPVLFVAVGEEEGTEAREQYRRPAQVEHRGNDVEARFRPKGEYGTVLPANENEEQEGAPEPEGVPGLERDCDDGSKEEGGQPLYVNRPGHDVPWEAAEANGENGNHGEGAGFAK